MGPKYSLAGIGFLLVGFVNVCTSRTLESKAAKDEPVPQVHGTHASDYGTMPMPHSIFEENNSKNFSWNDPVLQQRLWARVPGGWPGPQAADGGAPAQRGVQKRVFKTFGPAIQIPSCVGCAKAGAMMDASASQLLDSLDTDFMVSVSLLEKSQLQDRCIFYTSRPDQIKSVKSITAALSYKSTLYACMTGMVTIWFGWPSGVDVASGTADRDYYAMFEPSDSWLAGVRELGTVQGPTGATPAFIVYFQNMSRAIAQLCTGKIYVMSDVPGNLGSFTSIWGQVEYPQLLDNFQAQEVTSLTTIDSITGELVLIKDITRLPTQSNAEVSLKIISVIEAERLHPNAPPPAPKGRRSEEEWKRYEEQVKRAEKMKRYGVSDAWFDRIEESIRTAGMPLLQTRDNCLQAVSEEPAGMDFFG